MTRLPVLVCTLVATLACQGTMQAGEPSTYQLRGRLAEIERTHATLLRQHAALLGEIANMDNRLSDLRAQYGQLTQTMVAVSLSHQAVVAQAARVQRQYYAEPNPIVRAQIAAIWASLAAEDRQLELLYKDRQAARSSVDMAGRTLNGQRRAAMYRVIDINRQLRSFVGDWVEVASSLAAAYAAQRDFVQAVTTQRAVLAAAPSEAKAECSRRLALYQAGLPYRP